MKAALLLLVVVGAVSAQTFVQWAPPVKQLKQGSVFNDLDFYEIFAGPLIAVVDAQIAAAKSTSQFIQDVGFTVSNPTAQVLQVLMAEFHYKKVENNTLSTRRIIIPFLYLVPIPYVQVDSISISLNLKLNSAFDEKTNETVNCQGFTTDPQCRFATAYSMPSLRGSISGQSKTSTSTNIQKEYSLGVSVRASQGSMPGGMSRVLDLFELIVKTDRPPINKSKNFVG